MKTLSDGKEWAGFQAKAYCFADAAWNVPIGEMVGGAERSTTVGDAYLDLCFEGPPRKHIPDAIDELRKLRAEGHTLDEAWIKAWTKRRKR